MLSEINDPCIDSRVDLESCILSGLLNIECGFDCFLDVILMCLSGTKYGHNPMDPATDLPAVVGPQNILSHLVKDFNTLIHIPSVVIDLAIDIDIVFYIFNFIFANLVSCLVTIIPLLELHQFDAEHRYSLDSALR